MPLDSIESEDQYKTAFIIDWGAFVWVEMPFGVKIDHLFIKKKSPKLFVNTLMCS